MTLTDREKFSLPAFLLAGLYGTAVVYLLFVLPGFVTPPRIYMLVPGILLAVAAGLGAYFVWRPVLTVSGWREHGFDLLVWLACLVFAGAVILLGLQFPNLLTPGEYLLQAADLPAFVTVGLVSLAGTAVLLWLFDQRGYAGRIEASRPVALLIDNFPGLALALVFLIAYASLAFTLGVLPDDNFYDTDSTSWFNRFAAPADEVIEMRPVHPFAFLIFRPLVWLVSLFLAGDKSSAALLLNAGAGALCVFLAWMFVKDWSRNTTFALLVAALLGLANSHLILSGALETYIYSAAVLIAFLALIRRENASLWALVPLGLLTFGITITNFLQTLILFLFLDFKLIKLAKFAAVVLAASMLLAFLQAQIYPVSQPFYVPSNLLSEGRYSYSILREDFDHTLERAHVLGRTISLFSVIAPRPLVLLEETGCEFPCLQTYKHRWNGALINSYVGLGSALARTWFLFLLLAGGLFVWNWFRSPGNVRLQAALLTCVLFNFLLHMNYGDDPMLYSGDWTYAVVFFTAISFKDLAGSRWFQAGFLAFLVLIMVNNWRFLYAVLNAISPYIS